MLCEPLFLIGIMGVQRRICRAIMSERFECKVADVPKATKSMRIALQDLSLDEIFVVSPRPGTCPLAPKITASGIGEAITVLRHPGV